MWYLYFCDLEKAYDTTLHYGILSDLHQMGLPFLSDRCFRLWGTTRSDDFDQAADQKQGVPQGRILSVTLLIIEIHSKPLGLLRVVANSDWGVDHTFLLHLY